MLSSVLSVMPVHPARLLVAPYSRLALIESKPSAIEGETLKHLRFAILGNVFQG